MTTTFKYNGIQYTTNNLENKLKKLGISKNDIELLGNRDISTTSILDTHNRVIIKTPDNYYHISYIPKDSPIPSAYDLLKKNLWNGQTGIKEFTEEYLKGCVYEEKDTLLAL